MMEYLKQKAMSSCKIRAGHCFLVIHAFHTSDSTLLARKEHLDAKGFRSCSKLLRERHICN
jgi:hypothetical protein